MTGAVKYTPGADPESTRRDLSRCERAGNQAAEKNR